MRLRSAGLVAALIGIAVLVPLAGSAAGSPTAPAVALDTSCEDGNAARPDVPCTHGPDSVRAFGGMARLTDEPAAPGPAALTGLCSDGGVSGKRVEVLYGVPQDRTNRYADELTAMRSVLATVDANLDASDPGTTQHYRWLCENGADVTIRNVALLPVGSDNLFTFTDYLSSLQNQVNLGLGPVDHERDDRIYLTFVDEIDGVYPYAGQATVFTDDTPDPAVNLNNRYTQYAMSAYFDDYVVGHELGHALGAVQHSAPHASGALHCSDGHDLMCYDDRGLYFSNGGTLSQNCDVLQRWRMDCGDDDYYYPGTPPLGHYLADHWNTARSGFLTPLPDDAPTVAATSPVDAATGVAIGTVVTARFTEAVIGVSTSSVTLADANGAPVAAQVTYAPATGTATLDPLVDLAAGGTYTATLSAAIRDVTGNPLPATSWSFTTFADTIAPAVEQRSPAPGRTAVARGSTVTARFTEQVTGVGPAGFVLRDAAGQLVPAVVAYHPATRSAALDPAADLAPDSRYTATLTGGVKDLAGNALPPSSWSFTTGPAPTVAAMAPRGSGRGFAVGSLVTATFSEAVRGVGTGTFVLRTPGGTVVPAAVAYNATTRTATLDPANNLAPDTRYTATLTGSPSTVRDLAGNPLATRSWTFVTGPPPTLVAGTPTSGATGVSRTANIWAGFSEPVAGVSGTSFTLRDARTGAQVPAVVSRYGTTNRYILNPGVTLAADTVYTVRLTGGPTAIRDAAGNVLANRSWSFRTGR